MSQSKDIVACTFCDNTACSTSAMTAHFRRYIPELLPYTNYRRARTDPYHPLPVIREYVRAAGRNPWTARLLPAPPDATTHQVLQEFGRRAATAPAARAREWADRDFEAVSRKQWDAMLADVTAAYAVSRNTPKMRDHVERLVMQAIETTFAQDADPEPRAVIVDDDEMHQDQEADDDGDDDDDEEEEDPVRAHRVRRRGRGRAVVVENNASASNSARRDAVSRDITGGRVRVDQGIKNVLNVTDRARRAHAASLHGGAAVAAAEFDRFPLLDLVVHILGAVIRIPVQYNATLADVLAAIERHGRNPIRGLGVKGAISGRDAWLGVWTNEVWEEVVEEARGLDDAAGMKASSTVTYYVDFSVENRL